jgi:hypothetical protein
MATALPPLPSPALASAYSGFISACGGSVTAGWVGAANADASSGAVTVALRRGNRHLLANRGAAAVSGGGEGWGGGGGLQP